MKRLPVLTVVLLCTMALPGFQTARASSQSFAGTVSDAMCKSKHMMPGMSAAKCIEECIKDGSKYVLVAGDKTYTLAAKKETLQNFAGKHVSVVGELKGDTITVTSIK